MARFEYLFKIQEKIDPAYNLAWVNNLAHIYNKKRIALLCAHDSISIQEPLYINYHIQAVYCILKVGISL